MAESIRFCSNCEADTPHHSIKPPGFKLLEWICSVCGANNGSTHY